MADDSRLVPTPAPADRPTKTILVNNTVIAATYRVMTVRVNHTAHKIPEAEIVLLDGDVATETFEASNSADFIPGSTIEVKAGYHGEEKTIFKGIIVKHSVKVQRGRSSVMEIVAKHELFKLTLNRKNNSFKDKKDSEVLEELITTDKDVEATDLTHKHLLQPYCSDWDFINMRAEANGLFVLPHYDTLLVKKPVLDADPALTLYYGASILEFEAEMDARNAYTEVKVSGWSTADQGLIESTLSNSWNGKEPGNFTSNDAAGAMGNDTLSVYWHGDTQSDQLDAIAGAAMIRQHLAKIYGRVSCIGFADIWPGDIVNLNGVGDRFNGNAYVTGVQQALIDGSWETHIQFGWRKQPFASQYPDIVESPALGYLPGIGGLQVGIVKQLESDPLSEFRVLLQLPTRGGADEALWARVATLDAGKERGSFFRPEIGDEVIVGFIDENPLHAVILGGLHSSKNAAPVSPSDDNHIKGFYSREKMKWQMDDEKKEMLFDTPAGNKILVSEDQKGITLEDQNGNKIVMNDSGIEISTPKDFTVKASGSISITGDKDITVSAGTQFKSSGNAGAELSSNGSVTVKGSMVQVN